MSYSVMCFEKDEINEMKVETLGYETDSLFSVLSKEDFEILMKPNETIKDIKIVYQGKESFISEIIFVDWESHSWFEYGTRIFVCYHHAGDPSLFEVIVEVGKILKEISEIKK